MGIQELQTVKQELDAFATFNAVQPNGRIDPICRIAEGIVPDNADTSRVFFAHDADQSFRVDFGAMVLETDDAHVAHLGLKAESKLANDPNLLRGFVQVVMERVGVETATIRPEIDTNVSELALRRAGAIAISPELYEFHQAA